MASLKEIKTRIASVQSTRKITSAMKMVASSKLHHAQNAIESMLPYEAMLEHILKTFLVSTPDTDTPFDEERPVKRVALLVFSSNSSLCGGFNANVIKLLQQTIDEYHAKGLTDKDIVIYPVGRKVFEAAKKRGYECVYPYPQLADKPNSEECRNIAKELGQKWLKGEFDKVEIIYHHFKSAGSQVLQRKNFLPIDLEEELNEDTVRDLSSNISTKAAQDYLKKKGQTETQKSNSETVTPLNDDFIIEPDLHTVLTSLVPKLLHLMVYTALLDSNASEHAARMVAMQTATDNADDLLRSLNLQYNKSRQAAITSELLDIMGGSVNN
ncbi:F0F1 ATP synthase subunit gamma [Prevotella jejuni]|jgi:ATP synthase F1, gamma subunit|uniref:F0F1 ATP synthase subunit gamma n=2 Tax=Prevotella jejuni TaxID=1177574 RepID=UPI001BAB5D86|nr:F0F1 ATP synthase subunit gamma [Prevotella jejuni]MBF1636693.1 F0F1 ATP synthase subunit gamma [Prevotella sp.]DAP72324.1 MAG TPA: F0F1 ATP synthase subunit gamma [Bacteriophage sp.]MBW4772124.1 F0F1 ATP synthase subunit gamma [Prevotella jejuni]QUB79884.1 F0F1 ATP synthase subunit gamma [Prevotella jejuni]QUB82210.1 F0F1 ATP synthase subunit gamma [Prevotella jejuni]